MKTLRAEGAGLMAAGARGQRLSILQGARPGLTTGRRAHPVSVAPWVAPHRELEARTDRIPRRKFAGLPSARGLPPTTERGPWAMLCQPRPSVKHRPSRLLPEQAPDGRRRVRKLGPRLRGLTVVELEHAAELLTALQRTFSDALGPGRDE